MLPCNHYFHAYCVKEWLKSHEICPTCRNNVRNSMFWREIRVDDMDEMQEVSNDDN